MHIRLVAPALLALASAACSSSDDPVFGLRGLQDMTRYEAETIDLSVVAENADGSVSYTWVQTAGPTIQITGDDTATPRLVLPGVDAGPNSVQLGFRVDAMTAGGRTASKSITIDVLSSDMLAVHRESQTGVLNLWLFDPAADTFAQASDNTDINAYPSVQLWNPDGSPYYSQEDASQNHTLLYHVERDGTGRVALTQAEGDSSYAWLDVNSLDPDGAWVVHEVVTAGNTVVEFGRLSYADHTVAWISPPTGIELVSHEGFTETGIVFEYDDGTGTGIGHLDLGTDAWTVLVDPTVVGANSVQTRVAADGQHIAVLLATGGAGQVFLFETPTSMAFEVVMPDAASRYPHHVRWTPDSAYMVLATVAVGSPSSDFWSISADGQTVATMMGPTPNPARTNDQFGQMTDQGYFLFSGDQEADGLAAVYASAVDGSGLNRISPEAAVSTGAYVEFEGPSGHPGTIVAAIGTSGGASYPRYLCNLDGSGSTLIGNPDTSVDYGTVVVANDGPYFAATEYDMNGDLALFVSDIDVPTHTQVSPDLGANSTIDEFLSGGAALAWTMFDTNGEGHVYRAATDGSGVMALRAPTAPTLDGFSDFATSEDDAAAAWVGSSGAEFHLEWFPMGATEATTLFTADGTGDSIDSMSWSDEY